MQARQQQVNPLVSSSGAPGWSSIRTAGPALPHVLKAWGLPLAAAAQGPVSERLAQSLSWLDAVALAEVLNGALPAPAPDATQRLQATRAWARSALQRLQAELQAGFADPVLVREGPTTTSLRRPPARASAAPKPAGALDAVAPYRLHHSTQQRSLAIRATTLRGQLRSQLSSTTPRLARLAALDAVFERALQAREEQALASLPSMTAQRGISLRAADPEPDPEDRSAWPAPGWRGQLWDELQQVLQAELDLRLQPVLGLIEALHDDDTN
ncbi:DUF3348 family protein [Inhella proteolytica]|uniref:DUF3348 family protein n=1 Tax=Inhella proteolytica TaxID=2795029 RepID=A0A931J0I4_9BURK|nr:DUF3348 family protein [Inhella proteolytica]MBH9577239.1 DUF3348 family protein [Inhella proteolytica]